MVVKKREIHEKKLTSLASLARKQDRKSLQRGTILIPISQVIDHTGIRNPY
jgi:hypothetical protein